MPVDHRSRRAAEELVRACEQTMAGTPFLVQYAQEILIEPMELTPMEAALVIVTGKKPERAHPV